MNTPNDAKINDHIKEASFYDCHMQKVIYTKQSALDFYLQLMQKTPAWVDSMMVMRNKVVSKFGLKDLGKISNLNNVKYSDSYQTGDVLGIFTINSIAYNELILEDKDTHLNVRLSIYIRPSQAENITKVYITTIVHEKNMYGKLYMFFVKPMHKVIVPLLLNRLTTSTK